MKGNTKREEYDKAHRGKKCSLFLTSQLHTKLTWGRAVLEKPNAARPYGCPDGHSFQDSVARASATQKVYDMTVKNTKIFKEKKTSTDLSR